MFESRQLDFRWGKGGGGGMGGERGVLHLISNHREVRSKNEAHSFFAFFISNSKLKSKKTLSG